MAWSGAKKAGRGDGMVGDWRGGGQSRLRMRTAARHGLRRLRQVAAVVTAQSLVTSVLVPVAAVAAGVTAASIVATKAPARASLSGSVLILSTSVNGGSSSAEAKAASVLGLSVTVASASTWDAMSRSQFASYTAIIIGDPSATSCSATVPSAALSTASTWGPAITGNVAVLGTAPALAGASTLISDAIAYAASGASGTTGLYVSLNCEDSAAAAASSVPLLASVDGGGFTVTGQEANCPSDAGTVNTWEALALTEFNGLKPADLGPWTSPACSVQETFNSWPSGMAGVGYYTGAAPATFTASDGATGQAYIVAGAPVPQATAFLAMSAGGEVPVGTVSPSGSNPAAPGVSQPIADGVNTENGDFTQSSTDLSVPTFGPSLDFTRSYDAQAAQQQTRTGAPGALGYGWNDNWSSSLSHASPVPGDIYTTDGERTNNGNGGPPESGPLDSPGAVYYHNGDIYIVDTAGNRIQEIPGTAGTQWGLSMTAGDEYTVVGDNSGLAGAGGDGTGARSGGLRSPRGITFDSSGNMYIADTGNCRVIEIPASSGTHWGVPMTADDFYTVAGRNRNACFVGNDNKAATSSDLDAPMQIRAQGSGDLYIADSGNNRIQEVAGASETEWGQTMTAGDVYTVAGSAAGAGGNNGADGPATSALLNSPEGIGFSGAGDLYIAVTGNNKIQEVAASSGTQWGRSMTANDIYNVAGHASGAAGTGGDGGKAASAYLDGPTSITVDNGRQLYISDALNNRIQEVARTTHTEWGISMTANDIYTIAGSSSGVSGYSGNGGSATSAKLKDPLGNAVHVSGGVPAMWVADSGNNRVRQVGSSGTISAYAGNGETLATTGDGGPAIDAGLSVPAGEAFDAAGDVFIADSANNRIQEIAATTHTQYGINMTAGDVYTVAGKADGRAGTSSGELDSPQSVAVDAAGNLYIADTLNCRVEELSASGTMTTVAGRDGPSNCALGNDNKAATSSDLNIPGGVMVDPEGDIYIADTYNDRVQEVFASGGQSFGQSMTPGYVYTIAGSASGTYGHSGDGGKATSALLAFPGGVGADTAGDLYIADWGNNRIQEVPVTAGTQRGQSMTKYDIYTVAGSASGTAGISGGGGPATSAYLTGPGSVTVDPAGNIYVADGNNNRVQEVAAANGSQWGQPMTANDIYTIAGAATGSSGNSGDGGPATSALMNIAESVSLDPAGDVYITDGINNRLREVTSATAPTITPAPGLTSALYPAPGGITITEPEGGQVTFYAQANGTCASPYVTAGQYCALPQDVGASLTYDAPTGIYTFTPQPGSSDTYNTSGSLTSMSDAAGDTLTVSYDTPTPGSGNCPSSATWCQTVTAASGRALTVGYNASSLVTSVTDPMGRRWSYGYTGPDLTSVTDPMGNKTTYTYGAGTTGNPQLANDLLTITEPNAQPGGPDAGAHTAIAYDALGRVTSQTDPMGYKTTYDYSGLNASTGNGLVRVTDPDGNKIVYDYLQGVVAAQSAWTGTTLTSEQDFGPDLTGGGTSGGTLLDSWRADGEGNISTFVFNSDGYAVQATSPDGIGSQTATTTRTITSLDNISCDTTATAASTCIQKPGPKPVAPGGMITPPSSAPAAGMTYTQYDTNGNELWKDTAVYEPGSGTAAYQQISYTLYKGNGITVNGNNVTCTTTPPSASLPCAEVSPDGVVTQLAYNSAGDLTSTSTPDGNGSEMSTTTFAYDGDGEQTAATSPDGNLSGANAGNYTTVTAYNADGEQTSGTQGGGAGATVTPRTTSFWYDGDGNQTRVQNPRGYATTTTYNADDQATLVTDALGNAELTCFDGDGNVAQTVPSSGVATNNLTPGSCPTSYPSGYGNRLASESTTTTFDVNGNQTATTTPAPAGQNGPETITYTYDHNGNVIKTAAPPGANGGNAQITVYTYNTTGDLTSETTGYGTSAVSTTSYCYDPNGDQTSVVAPSGNTSGTAPCEGSSPWMVSSSANPAQAAYQTTSSYDSAGNLVSTTSPATSAAPNGATTTMSYDAAGKVLSTTAPNGVTKTFTYNPQGQATAVSYSGSSAHSVAYTFDANGQNTEMKDGTGSSSIHYDPFGEITSATDGAGQTVGYGYDADGNTTSITYPMPASATWATSNTIRYGYDHADVLNSVTDFNGNQIAITNNSDSLPASAVLGASGDRVTTNYDSNGSVSAITLKNNTATLQSFGYSDAPDGDALSETDTPSSTQSAATYTYDSQSRLTSMTSGTGTTHNYTFDASSNLTTLPSGAKATYDHNSEITSSTLAGTSTNYTYDASGQRLTAKQGSATLASATWDGADRLTSYSDAAANMGAATYAGNGLRTSDTITPAGGSATTQDFVWNIAGPELLMDGTNAYIYADNAAPAEQVNLGTGAVTYLISDSLGSVRGTVNASGALTGTTSYGAWGNPKTPGGLTASTPFGYAGAYTDPTGLVYLFNRYYEPATGQFISVDPAISSTGEPYQYAGGNPVSNSDPNGLLPRRELTNYTQWSKSISSYHICATFNLGISIRGIEAGGSFNGCTTIVSVQYHAALTGAVFVRNITRRYTALEAIGGWFRHRSQLCSAQLRFTFWRNGRRLWSHKRFRHRINDGNCENRGGRSWWMNAAYTGSRYCVWVWDGDPNCAPEVRYGTSMATNLYARNKAYGTWYRVNPSSKTVGVRIKPKGHGSEH